MRHLALRDASRHQTVKLAIFSEDAEGAFNIGDCLEASYVYGWSNARNNKKSLGMKKAGKLEVIFKT